MRILEMFLQAGLLSSLKIGGVSEGDVANGLSGLEKGRTGCGVALSAYSVRTFDDGDGTKPKLNIVGNSHNPLSDAQSMDAIEEIMVHDHGSYWPKWDRSELFPPTNN